MGNDIRICLMCEKEYSQGGKIYCSRSCSARHKNLNNNPSKTQEAREKISLSRQGKPTTTGRIHSKETRKKISEALKGKPSKNKGKPRSEETKKKLSIARKGKYLGADNPNWRGGTSPRDWKTTRYKEFLRQVWAREHGICQDCGCDSSEKKLQVHHILSWIEATLFRYDPNNGMLLCTTCHRKRDQQPLSKKALKRISRFARSRPRNDKGHFIKLHISEAPE